MSADALLADNLRALRKLIRESQATASTIQAQHRRLERERTKVVRMLRDAVRHGSYAETICDLINLLDPAVVAR